jgi:hypothetical protein
MDSNALGVMMAEPEDTPRSFPQTTPQDLYQTSDIRFVMLEIGKMMSKVDRLIDDVRSHGQKIDGVRHQISFVRGAMWVIGALIALVIALGTWYLRAQPPPH